MARVNFSAGVSPRLASCHFLTAPVGEERDQLLAEKVRELGLGRDHCVGIMAPGSYQLLQLEPPQVPQEEMRAAVSWSIRELVDFPLEEGVVDLFPVPNDGRRGRPDIAYAVAARKSVVRRLVEQLKDARLKVDAIDIPELALRNLALRLAENEKGVALLHFGEKQGWLTMARQGHLYMARNINVGLVALEDAAVEMSAEEEVLPPLLQDLFDSIVLEIQRSLDFFESSLGQAPITSLVLAPLKRDLPQLEAYLKAYLGIKVRSFDMAEIIDCDGHDSQDLRQCLLAIGAALDHGRI